MSQMPGKMRRYCEPRNEDVSRSLHVTSGFKLIRSRLPYNDSYHLSIGIIGSCASHWMTMAERVKKCKLWPIRASGVYMRTD